MVRAGRPPQDPARQLERAHRILDAAAELVLRWGYDKTTIDDVAKAAGVAKGTIYLHWRTRDDLFAALLRRERVHMLAEVRASGPATPRELFERLALGLLRRPLLKAVLLSDSEVLGKLTRRKRTSASALELGPGFERYLRELQALGLVRDAPAADLGVVIGSVLYGFLFLPTAVPEPARQPDEKIAALLADTVDRAIGGGRTPTAGEAEAVARATLDYLDAVEEVAAHKLTASLGTEERVS
ncbi:TetR/AcrR family transcriptional regulator [Nonomuraea pusilla]|uniref:Transcriptional regulator, TetR family n=1 Tax=Nonomuraea pusilla TaxID=46177 RepID=A0A1H7SI21_9ACTN|nr:TetR/AcrR family transcriptional regulator [Nonomuraea pusilla]SEL72321.1 transcriptional regulator, TetR family [Nonomuraea pusilla]